MMASWSSAIIAGFLLIVAAAGQSSLRGAEVHDVEARKLVSQGARIMTQNTRTSSSADLNNMLGTITKPTMAGGRVGVTLDNGRKVKLTKQQFTILEDEDARDETEVSSVEEASSNLKTALKLCTTGTAIAAGCAGLMGVALSRSPGMVEDQLGKVNACSLSTTVGAEGTEWCQEINREGGVWAVIAQIEILNIMKGLEMKGLKMEKVGGVSEVLAKIELKTVEDFPAYRKEQIDAVARIVTNQKDEKSRTEAIDILYSNARFSEKCAIFQRSLVQWCTKTKKAKLILADDIMAKSAEILADEGHIRDAEQVANTIVDPVKKDETLRSLMAPGEEESENSNPGMRIPDHLKEVYEKMPPHLDGR